MPSRYTFGPICLDQAQRELSVAGVPAKVSARAFDLLLTLVERRGRVVSKFELFDLVWPGLVIEENNLQVHVSALRKLLGPGVIATVRGRGYQFVAKLDHDGDAPQAIEGAAARPGARPAHRLPQPRTHFIGREAALAECARLLGYARLLTITGVGGCGKTRLALQVAHRHLDSFPGGVWFVDLAPLVDAADLSHAVYVAIGVRENLDTTLGEQLNAQLAGRKALLVLDNCEHVLEGVSSLADGLLAACAGVTIIATSRVGLGVTGEQGFHLRPLLLPADDGLDAVISSEAGRVFIDRARQVLPEFDANPSNAPAIAEVCRRLDGIALAIELAAARVKLLSVDELCARLNDRFKLLTSGTPTLPRHQTLRTVLEWSFKSLNEPEQRLFRCLAVFCGGCTLTAAARVFGSADEYAVLELLTQLHGKSMLEVARDGGGPPRYRMLETVRQYAMELLDEAGEAAAARSRHLAYCVELADQAAGPLRRADKGAWMVRLASERENLIAAHGWCEHAPGGGEAGLRLAAGLHPYWLQTGQYLQCLDLFRSTLARADPRADPRLRCEVLTAISVGYYRIGHHEQALEPAELALALTQTFDDALLRSEALVARATAHVLTDRLSQGVADFEECCAIGRAAGLHRVVSKGLNGLGEVHRIRGDLTAAQRCYEEATQLVLAQQHADSNAQPLANLARVLIATGALERARMTLNACLAMVVANQTVSVLAEVFDVAAALAAAHGDHIHAVRFYGVSQAVMAATGTQREPVDQDFITPLMQRCQDALGSEAFAAAIHAARAAAVEAPLAGVIEWMASGPPSAGAPVAASGRHESNVN